VYTLPAQPTSLIGREGEFEAVRAKALQAEVRLLTLTGPGGTGKTRLALAVASGLVDEFGEGVAFVDLSALHEPALVASTLLQALGVPEAAGETPLEALLRALHGHHHLLVLDNFEQLLPAAPLLAELLANCTKLKLLVTSRAALKLRWEHLFPVPPLAVPDPPRLPDVETLRDVPAVALFLRRARAVQPDFALTAENAPAVAGICHRLDGLPLALELAAPRLKLFGPQELLGRLEQRLDLLTAHASDVPTRQRTLHTEMDWSYGLLTEAEKRLFRRLGVFVGGFSAEAAEEICGDVGTDVLRGLEALVDQSLLRVEGAEGKTRFRMLETIREFARQKLTEQGEESAQTKRRHGEYYLSFLQGWGKKVTSAGQKEALEMIGLESANIRRAWEWALNQVSVHDLYAASKALCTFYDLRGRYNDGLETFARTAEVLNPDDPQHHLALGRALVAQAWLYKGLGSFGHAAEFAERALALLRPLGESWGVITGLSVLGYQHFGQGLLVEARGFWEEALRVAEAHQDGADVDAADCAELTGNLGLIGIWLGNYGQAEQHLHRALTFAREVGHHSAEVFVRYNLGFVKTYRGDSLGGRAAHREGLRIAREGGFERGVPHLTLRP